MKFPPLIFLDRLSFRHIHSDKFAYYAYTLTSCQGPASVVDGEWFRRVDDTCQRKIEELREEINRRFKIESNTEALEHALNVLDGCADLSTDTRVENFDLQTLSQLSTAELIRLHSLGKNLRDLRRSRKLEDFTRCYQWQIVNELLTREPDNALAKTLFLAECLEAEGIAHILGLTYKVGDRPMPFYPSAYRNDEKLATHVKSLSVEKSFMAREELIEIADYVQAEIVDVGNTAEHMGLVNAILSTGMPDFRYPNIAKAFEDATNALAKSAGVSRMELAPAYFTLWSLTLKPSYLSRFEKTARHCYLTLAHGKSYPDLGVNVNDRQSLSNAIKFIDENRQTLWILNEKYDVDKVISKYRKISTKP